MDPNTKYPEILEAWAALVAAALMREGIDRETAERAAGRAVERVRAEWGGQKVYIPRGRDYDVANMRAEIARRWDGRNTLELCRELNISESRLRQLNSEASSKKTA